MISNNTWNHIFSEYDINNHNFNETPYVITSTQIKEVSKHYSKTVDREVRLLCKQDSREDRPTCFLENDLFLLPIQNGTYSIVKGEGYLDVGDCNLSNSEFFKSNLSFDLDTSFVGDSEMQHLDYAFATGMLSEFVEDKNLHLTIRGRKYTPEFHFFVGNHRINVKSVQTEVDAGYESDSQIVLIEAKNSKTKNTIIRQLYYPFRQWSNFSNKRIKSIFFEKRKDEYNFWEYSFSNELDYNSIELVKHKSYKIKEN